MATAASNVAVPFPVSINNPLPTPELTVLSVTVIESISTLFVSAMVDVRDTWFAEAEVLVNEKFSLPARVKSASELNVAVPLNIPLSENVNPAEEPVASNVTAPADDTACVKELDVSYATLT